MKDMNYYLVIEEKAFAYKMKMDAMKHQDKTLSLCNPKLRSSEIIAKTSNDAEKLLEDILD